MTIPLVSQTPEIYQLRTLNHRKYIQTVRLIAGILRHHVLVSSWFGDVKQDARIE